MFSLPVQTSNTPSKSGEVSKPVVKHKTSRSLDANDFGIINEQPAYPAYTTLESRINSFKKWTKTGRPSVEELARSGFAYTGVGDSVRCYFCTLGVRDWQTYDCPWTQHALQSPSCGHLRRCKGDSFIAHVQNGGRHSISCDVDESEEESILNFDSLNNMSRVWKLNSVAIAAVKDFIPDEKKVKTGINVLLSRGIESFTGVELMEAIEEIENNELFDNIVDQEQKEKLKNENMELRQPVSCKICMDAVASAVTLPCGHMFSCPQCIASLTKCAICRIKIQGTVRATLCTFDKEMVV